MADGNFIKLSRKLLKWEWYDDIKVSRLFVHFLLKANWKDGKFRGIDIPRGSFVSSIGKLVKETELSTQEVKTAISKLKSTNEITSKATTKFTVFTVVNYNSYQANNQQINQQATNEQPTSNKRATTIEERKNVISEEKDKTVSNLFLSLSPAERAEYLKQANSFPRILEISQ